MTTITRSDVASKGLFWQATLLISGTCIGGGMLAMPVQTAESGFFLSVLSLFICWAFMTLTGLFLSEAALWVRNDAHFSSLSRILIGHGTKILALVVYLFMNYASLVAYVAGAAVLINTWVFSATGITLGYSLSCVLFTACFGMILFLGIRLVSQLNFWLVLGLAGVYFGLVSFGIGGVKNELLAFRPAWKECLGSIPIILATFSYQMVIPSVCSILKYDTRYLKKAIIVGTSIPCLVYILWICVIHGTVPLDGVDGLRAAQANGSAATIALRACFNHWALIALADLFGFLAVVTSYLGLSVALLHFLNDTFKEMKVTMSQNLVILLTIIPALILAIFFPRALLQCLDISGGFGDTILSGLIPLAMVWIGRYRKGFMQNIQVSGGKLTVAASALFFLFILTKEVFRFLPI